LLSLQPTSLTTDDDAVRLLACEQWKTVKKWAAYGLLLVGDTKSTDDFD
jgi:hypothetical protein